MTDIEQEARAEAERRFPSGTRGLFGFEVTRNADMRAGFQQGYIAGASRPASPASAKQVSREAVARWACEYMGDPDEMASDYFEFADALLAAFTITEKGDEP